MLQNYITQATDFFINGGFFMYPLALCSLLAGAAVLYKWVSLRKNLIIPTSITQKLISIIQHKSPLSSLADSLQHNNSVLARLLDTVIQHKSKSETQIKELVQAQAREEFVRLQSGIPLLDMVINIAPMFGILGTASGLVVVFSAFGNAGDQSGVAMGIAQALNTTIVGLAIAAPSVVAHMYFSRRLEKLSASLESIMAEFIDTVVNDKLS